MTKKKKTTIIAGTMKKGLLALTLGLTLFSTSASAQDSFKVNGTVGEGVRDVKYYIYYSNSASDLGTLTDSVDVADHHFVYSTSLYRPKFIQFRAVFDDGSLCSGWCTFVAVPHETCDFSVGKGSFTTKGSKFYQGYDRAEQFYEEAANKYSILGRKVQEDLKQKNSSNMIDADSNLLREYYDESQRLLYHMASFAQDNEDDAGVQCYFAKLMGYDYACQNASSRVKRKFLDALFNKDAQNDTK